MSASDATQVRERASFPEMLALLAIGGAFTLAIIRLVVENSHFSGDDLGHFYTARRFDLLDYIFLPDNVNVTPLHRLASHILYHVAPMSYPVGLGVMVAFHLGGVAYLYATLQRLQPGPLSARLTCLYALNPYLFVPLMWWSSGIRRFAYILFALAAIYHYVRFRESGSWTQVALVAAAAVLACGFFTKGFLIPLYLVGIELCLASRTRRETLLRNGVAVGLLMALSVGGFVAIRLAVRSGLARLEFDWAILGELLLKSAQVFAKGMAGFVPTPGATGTSIVVALAGSCLVAFTVYRSPRTAIAWVVMLGLVGLNIAVLATSGRTSRWGIVTVYTHRYYFELTFVALLFSGIALQDVRSRRAALSSLTRRRLAAALVVLGVAIYALVSYSSASDLRSRRYAKYSRAKSYIDNLEQSVASLPDSLRDALPLIDRRLPGFLGTGFTRLPQLRRHEGLLDVLDVRTTTPDPGGPRYRVSQSGRLERLDGRADPRR